MIDRALYRKALSAFRPPDRPGTAAWAEKHMKLTCEMAAQPGKIRLSAAQKAALAAIDDRRTPTVVLMWSAQTGKSTLIDAATLYGIAADPLPSLLVHPTESKAKDYVRTRLDPLIDGNPTVKPLIGKNAQGKANKGRGAGDGVCFKAFPGGSLTVASSYKPEDLAARPIGRLLLDEVDRYAVSAGREGDPILIALKRCFTFGGKKQIVLTSTPTHKGASRVHDWYKRGTMEEWNIPCARCGCMFVPSFECVVWEPKKPKTARLQCPECEGFMSEAERKRAVDKGEFLATNPEPEEGIRSFHLSVLGSKFGSMFEVVKEFEAADTPDKLRVFWNTTMGLPFDSAAETENDPDDLQERAVEVGEPYPKDLLFISAGADVQGNRIEATFLGHCPKRRIVLDHVVIGGDPTGSEVWANLRRELGRTFKTADRRELAVQVSFVDANYLSPQVHKFAMANPRVYATIGRAGWDRQPIRQGHRLMNSPKRLLVLGVDQAKLNIAKYLQKSGEEENAIILPNHLQSDYFEQLASEKLETKFVRGFSKQSWVKDPTVRNEAFDTLVYAYLAGQLVRKPMKPANAKKGQSIGELAAALNRDGQVSASSHSMRY